MDQVPLTIITIFSYGIGVTISKIALLFFGVAPVIVSSMESNPEGTYLVLYSSRISGLVFAILGVVAFEKLKNRMDWRWKLGTGLLLVLLFLVPITFPISSDIVYVDQAALEKENSTHKSVDTTEVSAPR